jgi:nickel transport protein
MVLEPVVVGDGKIASHGSLELTRKEHMMSGSKTKEELMRILLGAAVVLSLLGFFPANACAHRVNVFAWAEGGRVFVECKWPDGKRVHEGTIRVLDAGGAELLTGKTDQEGNFSFKIPKQEELKIVLEAGMGHRAEWTISKEDVAAAEKTVTKAPSASFQQPSKSEPAPAVSGEVASDSQPLAADIEQTLERVLDKKLAPILRMLAESREQGPKLSEVLGGIGYILGLVGIAAYFKRK